ncbi:MAG: competence/damage-inducible protein A [Acidobacteria bacterium RBG_16_68_9]|nr:MAG: competence/damage-inducible protein A [Acidobacteria bacterium RBG_16_68_9]
MLARAFILSTGDELIAGRTVDTNGAYIADKLAAVGIDVLGILTVGDYPDRLARAWRHAMQQAEVIISTGGLGPTADDLTTETVAAVTDRGLTLNTEVADRIRQMFTAMNRPMPENNLKQARFPEGAVIIPNALGTAPGFRMAFASEWGPRQLVVMPGVPREMKLMIEEHVLPWLRATRGGDEVYLSHTFQTFGVSESALDQMVAGAIDPAEGRVAFRAAFPQISVRVTVHGPPGQAPARLEAAAARLRERVRDYCYGEGDTSMEEVVGRLLVQRGATVAVGESCTGGLIGHRLTNVPGSSAYLVGGVVAYSNAVKVAVLGVSAETLERHGAVSTEVAAEMAAGARRLTGATLGLATTGIAGPEGGTPEKPVGTVCIALAAAAQTYTQRYQLWGTREWIKVLTSQIALDWVRRAVLGTDPTASGFRR